MQETRSRSTGEIDEKGDAPLRRVGSPKEQRGPEYGLCKRLQWDGIQQHQPRGRFSWSTAGSSGFQRQSILRCLGRRVWVLGCI